MTGVVPFTNGRNHFLALRRGAYSRQCGLQKSRPKRRAADRRTKLVRQSHMQ